MYAQLEEDFGLAKRSMAIYERAAQAVSDEDKFEMYTIYIAKATANFGLPATRPIYERALEGELASIAFFPIVKCDLTPSCLISSS
jgi:pre-mRNA-splicing factor SYF1